MPSNGLELLEFSKLKALLASLAGSHLGRRRLEALAPFSERAAAEETLGLVAGLKRLDEAGRGLAAIELGDLGPVFRRLDRVGAALSPEAFLALGELLAAAREAKEVLADADGESALRALGDPLTVLPHLERAVERVFEPSGEIRDGASPVLRRIRRERERLREALRRRLERLAAKISSPEAPSVVTLRDGRYVLSVPLSRQSKVPGLVLDRSGSGQTVYVEPMASVRENNALRETDAEEREEIRKILEALTRDFAAEAGALERNWRHLGTLDALRARVRLARRWNGEKPELSAARELRLTGARHPLLLEARGAATDAAEARASVVPLRLELGGDARFLLVTGPNMGGKTVALKCVGLLSVMAQCGCLIPVDPGCRLPWVERWVADVGDEQSLEQDLSTFGARLGRWAEALGAAGPGTLVLLDELGSGTDPTEGAALAQSVLERLVEAGGLGVVTTHLGSLKAYAAETAGIRNASMVFDTASHRPTYTLAVGVPGESHAIEMARRLGLPEERVRRAEALLPQGERDLKRLLAEVTEERALLRRRLDEAAEAVGRAHAAETEARGRLERILEERAALRARAARRAREILRRAEEEIRETRAVGHRGAEEVASRRRRLAREQARLARLEQPRRKPRPAGKVPEAVTAGETYWAEVLERTVEVVRETDDAGRVLVSHGGLKVELPVSALRTVEHQASAPSAVAPPAYRGPSVEAVPLEVDLRGLRAEEALGRLEQALDRSLLAGHPELRVIHGKGTGVLQKVVEDYCRRAPAVVSFRIGEPSEGGSGATVIRLEN